MRMHCLTAAVAASLVALPGLTAAQTPPPTRTFPLTDTAGLVARGVAMDTGEAFGRKAVRLVKTRAQGVAGFVPLPAVDFQDGTIEADVAVKVT